ncbi:MAG: hypothetical protein Q9182_004200 [Xanthomendoza sp. 2 TL-2023]
MSDSPTSIVHFMDQAPFIARSPQGAHLTSTAQVTNNSGRPSTRDDIFDVPNENLSRVSLAQLPSAEDILKGDHAFYEAHAKPPFVCRKAKGQVQFTAVLADGRGHRTNERVEIHPKDWSSDFRYWQTIIDGYECIVKKCIGGTAGFCLRLWLGHERGLDGTTIAHPASRSSKAVCSLDDITPATKLTPGAVKTKPLNSLAKGKKPSFGLAPLSTKKRPNYREPSLSSASNAEEDFNLDNNDHDETMASTRTRRKTKKPRLNNDIPSNPEVSNIVETSPARNLDSPKPSATTRPISVKKRKQQTASPKQSDKRTLPHSNNLPSTTVHKTTNSNISSQPEIQGWHAPLAPPKPPSQSDTQAKKKELARREREIRTSLQALLYEELRDIKAQQEELAHADEDLESYNF